MVKHRYRLFCGAASRSDHALRKKPCRGDPIARFRVPRRTSAQIALALTLEAEPADLIGWTEGRALVAAGTHGGLISRFRLKSRHDKLLDETEALLYCDYQFDRQFVISLS
jgi:hypothetical protein